jgi:hypothetical protein
VLLSTLFMGVLADWILGVVSVEQLRREASYGFAVALSAYADESARRRLKARMSDLEVLLKTGRAPV